MAVSHGHRHDPRKQIEISLARLVVEVLHVPLDDEQRLFVDRVDRGIRELLPHCDEFFAGRTIIRARNVIYGGKFQLWSDRGHRKSRSWSATSAAIDCNSERAFHRG